MDCVKMELLLLSDSVTRVNDSTHNFW